MLIPLESQLLGATLFLPYVAPILESTCKCIMMVVAIMKMVAIMMPMMTDVMMEHPMMWSAYGMDIVPSCIEFFTESISIQGSNAPNEDRCLSYFRVHLRKVFASSVRS